jgi:thiol-disulfide isomerase/thioredoxin
LYRLRAELPGAGFVGKFVSKMRYFKPARCGLDFADLLRGSRMKFLLSALLLSVAGFWASGVFADDWTVHGKVVDEKGQPVADASVCTFWSGNGKRLKADGTPLKFGDKTVDPHDFWSHIGEMETVGDETSTISQSDGSFAFKVQARMHTFMVMDKSRQRGALVRLAKGREEEPVEVRLGPIVRVRGNFVCAENGKQPNWAIADMNVVDSEECPLDNTRIAMCGTYEGRFELSLPLGDYALYSNGNATEQENDTIRLHPFKPLKLDGTKSDIDLGAVALASSPYPRVRVETAKANGTCFDYQKHYGEAPPAWHITEARGVSKDVKISDYKGKWVLLTFWGNTCTYCLGTELPNLMKFYEEHNPQRDQFEILSIYIDYEGELKSLADVDKTIAPIVKNVWGGKQLPFPILFDPTFKTWETFGIDGLGTTILIDPDGKLVEGDEKTLAAKLK